MHINIVTDSNISYEITNAVPYNVYVLQNNSVYLNGLIKSPVSYKSIMNARIIHEVKIGISCSVHGIITILQ